MILWHSLLFPISLPCINQFQPSISDLLLPFMLLFLLLYLLLFLLLDHLLCVPVLVDPIAVVPFLFVLFTFCEEVVPFFVLLVIVVVAFDISDDLLQTKSVTFLFLSPFHIYFYILSSVSLNFFTFSLLFIK